MTFQIASKFYWRLFLLFKKVKICLLLIIFITSLLCWRQIFLFSFFWKKQTKSSNAIWNVIFLKKSSRWSRQKTQPEKVFSCWNENRYTALYIAVWKGRNEMFSLKNKHFRLCDLTFQIAYPKIHFSDFVTLKNNFSKVFPFVRVFVVSGTKNLENTKKQILDKNNMKSHCPAR